MVSTSSQGSPPPFPRILSGFSSTHLYYWPLFNNRLIWFSSIQRRDILIRTIIKKPMKSLITSSLLAVGVKFLYVYFSNKIILLQMWRGQVGCPLKRYFSFRFCTSGKKSGPRWWLWSKWRRNPLSNTSQIFFPGNLDLRRESCWVRHVYS